MGAAAASRKHQKVPGDWINVPPVFIVGCERSGARRLGLMLNEHSRISISSEGGYIYRLRSSLSSHGDLSDPNQLKALYQDLQPYLEAEQFVSAPAFDDLLDWVAQFGANPRSIMTFFGTWRGGIQDRKQLAWWGIAASYYRCDPRYLDSVFPDCKFILVVRDPRDVFASRKADCGSDFLTFRDEWEESILQGLLLESYVGSRRAIHVKYEDLITKPRGQLQHLCRFLDVDYPNEPFTALQDEFGFSRPHGTRNGLTQDEYDAIGMRLHSPMRLWGYLSHDEYDRFSRLQLRRIANGQSKRLKNLVGKRANGSRPLPRLEMISRHWTDISPVFILGQGRSGTTLLRMMLSSHPKIFISSEGAYICPLRSQMPMYGDLRDPRNLEKMHNDLRPWLEAVSYLNPPQLENLIEWVGRFGCDERSLITFYGTWEARTLGKNDLAWWGDNEPSHVFNIPYFKKLFPNAKFILLIRDPRDVYASYKTAWPGVHTAESSAMSWQRCLLDGALAISRLGSATVQQVRYENLVRTPEAQLKVICRFLGVEYTDAVMNFYETEAAKHLSQAEHHLSKNVALPVFKSSVGRYRQVLTEEEVATIQERLSFPMTYLRYLSYKEYDEVSRDKTS